MRKDDQSIVLFIKETKYYPKQHELPEHLFKSSIVELFQVSDKQRVFATTLK